MMATLCGIKTTLAIRSPGYSVVKSLVHILSQILVFGHQGVTSFGVSTMKTNHPMRLERTSGSPTGITRRMRYPRLPNYPRTSALIEKH